MHCTQRLLFPPTCHPWQYFTSEIGKRDAESSDQPLCPLIQDPFPPSNQQKSPEASNFPPRLNPEVQVVWAKQGSGSGEVTEAETASRM